MALTTLSTLYTEDKETECGGKLVGPGGTISSPNYPSSYPNNAKCNWTIMAGVNEIINLEFKIVDFDGYMDACPDYAVIYDGDSIRSPVIQQLCRYKNSTELTSLFVRSTSNKVYVTFTSDAFNQRQGFLANYWTHACQPMTYGPQRCTQNCSCLAENTVFCNNFNGSCTCKKGWTSPTCGTDIDECAPPLNEACPRDYQICKNKPGSFECECQAGLVRNETTGACQADTNASCTSACPGLCGKVTFQGQVTPTEQCYCPYNTKLDGSQCLACTNLTYGRNCERSCSTCDKTNTQRCDNVTGQCICLPGWSGSTCADDVDECRFSGNLRVCRETTGNYHCVNTIGSYRCDCNQGYEKVANGTCTPIVCNFTLNASTGNITSPYYPENYYSLIPCTWTITVATGKSINLRFSQFYAQDFYSFVHIFDGHNADSFLLFRFHSSVVNKVIRTTGNTMHIKFNSTIKIYGRFNGTYTTNDFASGCKQSINATDERQILKNPGYPTYINNTVCYWAIHAPVGYNVSLRFTDFLLDTQGKSFLQVYNPRNAVLGIYGLFYGVPIPKAITSADNTLYVLFQSDGSIAGRGFNATFLRCLPFYYGEEKCTTPCSCVKNNTQYCDSFNGMCTCYPGWQSATCADDVDECLSNPCYLTEKCVNTLGSFRCIPDCDSNLTSVSGSISTIGYPNYHLRRALCKWRIQGSAGQVVTLSIKSQDFQLVEERQCSWDSLNIFSVGNTTSTQIGRYCGTRVPPLIRTSCNIMEIQLKTEADEYWSRRGFTGVYYTHSCNDFTYGPTCQFTCTCNLSKTQFCDNTNGVCVCKPGWTGDTCSEDVNECNYNTCPTNEVCKNTPGNYSCECRLGFSRTETGQCEGNTLNCVTAKNKTCSHFCYRNTSGVLICTCPENMEIGAVENQCAVTLYPYGADKGDSGLIKTSGSSKYVSKPIVFATKVPVGYTTENEAYVFSDGVIRFGGNVISGTYDLAVQNGFKIIAPYWATLDPTKGEVFYHLYESCEPTVFYESATVTSSPAKAKVMERAAQDVRNTYRFYDFKVKTVLVATWKNVQILSSVIKTNPPTGTFQAVYISGYRKESIGDQDFIDEETAYVYFLYPKGEMNIIALKNSDTTIGISASPYANKIQVSQTTFDWIKNKNYNEIITYQIGKISGPEQKCEKHVCKNSQLITNADYRNQISQLYTCPCTLDLLGLQWSLYEKRGALKDIFCFVISPVAKRRILQNNPRNKLCCYKWTQPSVTSDWMKWAESRQQASFIHNTPDAGHVLVGDPWWSLAANESLEAQRSCCKDGNVGKLCDRYNLLYPDNECSYDVTFVPGIFSKWC
ncbi:cubilin-like [Physella acuta]|uniref:cubilin-like n=1 Tax=Physella acuta TaxID=109671 RepID=UPI0027DADA88|nr:cubilin-like [Physella acuta]